MWQITDKNDGFYSNILFLLIDSLFFIFLKKKRKKYFGMEFSKIELNLTII